MGRSMTPSALIAGLVVVFALRAFAKRKREPSSIVTIGPAQLRPPGGWDVSIGAARIGGRSGAQVPGAGPAGVRRPLTVRFDVRLNGFEKMVTGPASVKQAVASQADTVGVPGKGAPSVAVADVSSGYVVTVKYPDSSGSMTAREAQSAIEGIDPRLKGRIANVVVSRA